MEEATAKRTGTGLHLLISKKKYKEGDKLIILKPDEWMSLYDINKAMKTLNDKIDELMSKSTY